MMTPTRARVAVIGAHGKVGQLLIPVLVEKGYAVSGIVRSEQQLPRVDELGGDGVLLDVGSATEDELAAAFEGHDGVIWTAGAGGGSPERTYSVDRDAAIRSMTAAATAGANRYVMISWAGSKQDHGIDEDNAFFPYADAKLAADDHLRGTGLEWTILGPGALTEEPATGEISVDPSSGETSRGNVALVAAAVLETPETVGRFVPFANGSTAIGEALRNA
jgi:uncharacterized protein YbjT (DUF2867 family)